MKRDVSIDLLKFLVLAYAVFCGPGWYTEVGGYWFITGCEWLQLLTIPVLSIFLFYLYKVAKSRLALALMEGKAGRDLTIVGGLCLEVCLSHRVLLNDRFNHLFPLNFLGIFVAALAVAYLVRCLSRFLVQTFNMRDGYEFDEGFRLR